jgi:hypothetical protein
MAFSACIANGDALSRISNPRTGPGHVEDQEIVLQVHFRVGSYPYLPAHLHAYLGLSMLDHRQMNAHDHESPEDYLQPLELFTLDVELSRLDRLD